MAAISPYSTALELKRPAPTYTPGQDDTDRIQSYFTYDDIYNNVKEAFAAVLRVDDGGETSKRYLPGSRVIIEATNRYLGLDLQWTPSDPPGATVPENNRVEVMAALDSLFRREELNAKFMSLKREMLIKGDALLHVTADPLKPEGTRIRITELAPESYFPIHDEVDAERVIGCYIVTQVVEGENASVVGVQRLEYRRILTEDDAAAFGIPIGSIFVRLGFFEEDGWDDRAPFTADDLAVIPVPASIELTDALQLLLQGMALPAQITAIPAYHFRNNRRGNRPFGTSELQGIETILAGEIQTLTDEDLSVALAGIGVYWTDSPSPKDPATGQEVDWVIGPAAIIELEAGTKFGRVEGVGSVQPLQDHLSALKAASRESTATPDIAVGRVDVQVAQSGIALSIEMAPILAKNAEKETEIRNKLDQMMFDLLNGWLPAYEGVASTGLIVTSSFGNPLPLDRTATLAEILDMLKANIISAEFARQLISEKLGYTFPADMLAQITAEQSAMVDAVGARVTGDLAATE